MSVDIFIKPRTLNAVGFLLANEEKMRNLLKQSNSYKSEKHGDYHVVETMEKETLLICWKYDHKLTPSDFCFGAVQMFGGDKRIDNAKGLCKTIRKIIKKLKYNPKNFRMYISW